MATVGVTAATTVVFCLFTSLAQCEEAVKSQPPVKFQPTKEACQIACLMGFKTKLGGRDKELFNQCADAKHCSDPDTHYYAVEPENNIRRYTAPSWVWG